MRKQEQIAVVLFVVGAATIALTSAWDAGGAVVAQLLGMAGAMYMIVGVVISLTIVGAIVGIPLAIVGLLLALRGLF